MNSASRGVEEFVRSFVAAVNIANHDRGLRQAALIREQSKLTRQIRNMLELIKEGHGTPAMVGELRGLEQRHATLATDIATIRTSEPVPVLHPNLPGLYRRKVEALEDALREPATEAAAIEALRSLIDAILVYPGERHGEVRVELRGDLAAFMHLPGGGAHQRGSKTATHQVENGGSGELLGSLVAGTGFEPVTFRL